MSRNHPWYLDNPVGDPFGGPAAGKYEDASTLGLISSGLGAYLGYQGSQNAAGQLIGAANQANQTIGGFGNQAIGAQNQATGLASQLINPTRQTGNYAQQALAQALGLPNQGLDQITLPNGQTLAGTQTLGAPGAGSPLGSIFQPFNYTADQFHSSPGYQFALDQGLKTIENNAAARGMTLSPNTIQALQQYSTGLANQDYQQQYQNAYNAYTQNQSNVLNSLGSMMGQGNTASTNLAGNIAQSGSNISNLLSSLGGALAGNQLSAGSAAAAGRVGATNALTGGLGNISNLLTAGRLANGVTGGGLTSGLGDILAGISPGLAGSLGDTLGMSIGGVYGPGIQSGLDALIGSFSGGSGAAAGAGTAGLGAAGAGADVGAGAGLGGAGLGTAALAAAPFALAIGGMLGGVLGYSDDGTPYTQANDAWANAVLKNPALLQQYGQGGINNYMQGMFGGNQWTNDQYNQAKSMLSAASGGGTFLGNFLGGAEQGMGG